MDPSEKPKLFETLKYILQYAAPHDPPICDRYTDEYGNTHVRKFEAPGALLMLKEHDIGSSYYGYVVVVRGTGGTVRYAYAWVLYDGATSSCGVEYYDFFKDLVNRLDREIGKRTSIVFFPSHYTY